MLRLSHTQKRVDTIFIVVDQLFKITHFFPFCKTFDVPHMSKLFFQEIVRLHGVPSFLVLDRDIKFLAIFELPYGGDLIHH